MYALEYIKFRKELEKQRIEVISTLELSYRCLDIMIQKCGVLLLVASINILGIDQSLGVMISIKCIKQEIIV